MTTSTTNLPFPTNQRQVKGLAVSGEELVPLLLAANADPEGFPSDSNTTV